MPGSAAALDAGRVHRDGHLCRRLAAAQLGDQRHHAADLLLGGDGRGARRRAGAANVEHVCAEPREPLGVRSCGGQRAELAAVREGVGRRVEDAHHQGALAPAPGAAGQRRGAHEGAAIILRRSLEGIEQLRHRALVHGVLQRRQDIIQGEQDKPALGDAGVRHHEVLAVLDLRVVVEKQVQVHDPRPVSRHALPAPADLGLDRLQHGEQLVRRERRGELACAIQEARLVQQVHGRGLVEEACIDERDVLVCVEETQRRVDVAGAVAQVGPERDGGHVRRGGGRAGGAGGSRRGGRLSAGTGVEKGTLPLNLDAGPLRIHNRARLFDPHPYARSAVVDGHLGHRGHEALDRLKVGRCHKRRHGLAQCPCTRGPRGVGPCEVQQDPLRVLALPGVHPEDRRDTQPVDKECVTGGARRGRAVAPRLGGRRSCFIVCGGAADLDAGGLGVQQRTGQGDTDVGHGRVAV